MSGIDAVLVVLQVFFFLVLGRVIISWIPLFTQRPLNPRNPIVRFLVDVTEPVLAPIRRFTMIGMIDLSPLVLIFLIQFIFGVLASQA
jgi:YggT family protein